jgi:3-phenylpropionate/trans-cinnamate dioxygenase ferredoxin component
MSWIGYDMEKEVATLSDFGDAKMLPLIIDGERIVLFLLEDGTVKALEDRCSHADVRLSRGCYEDGVIECPAHGARFDVQTGEHLCLPAVGPVKTFPTRVDGATIYVTLES